jgi:uncharacterized protein with HEPN domain
MPRDSRLFLRDILHAIQQIEQSVTGIDETVFLSQHEKLNSVLFNLMTIGEATKNIPERVRSRYPQVPWSLMARFRDLVVHHYWNIEPTRIWQITKENIPELLLIIETILAEWDELSNDTTKP